MYFIKAKKNRDHSRPPKKSQTLKKTQRSESTREIFFALIDTQTHTVTRTLLYPVTNLLLCAGGAHGDNVRIAQRSEPRGFRRLEFQQLDVDDDDVVDPTRQDHPVAAPEHGVFEFGFGFGLGSWFWFFS